jgi:hypothetical protein
VGSLHYVDDDGRPLNVRRLYRSWVIAFAVIAMVAGYAAFTERNVRRFSLGAWEGASATAAIIAAAYSLAWWNDRRHTSAPRSYWLHRNVREAKLLVGGAGVGEVVAIAGFATALHTGHDYVAGLLLAPLILLAVLLVLGITVSQRQRARGE